MGMFLGPDKFDVDFTEQKRAQLPPELDEPLRRMIREV